MNNIKEVAEKIIEADKIFYDIHVNAGVKHPTGDDVTLARAYLELEAGLNERGFITKVWIENNTIKSEITKLKDENEKLKKSREVLKEALLTVVCCGNCNGCSEKASEAIKADDDIMGVKLEALD